MTKTRKHVSCFGFTMAEILLSLTIIGVVAAITLPSLTGNINERTWNTQRKALYARMSQAISLMPALNGYGTYVAEVKDANGSITTSGQDNVAETFVTAGLSKVLKINNICDNMHLQDCGIATNINALNASNISTPTTMEELNYKMLTVTEAGINLLDTLDTKAVAFETGNGESILTFYNPNCVADMAELSNAIGEQYYYQVQPKICANFVFDLNGNKGPNTVGKDIGFMTVFYPTDSVVVAPDIPVQKAETKATHEGAIGACKRQDENYRMATLDEIGAMFVNDLLINGQLSVGDGTGLLWSSNIVAGHTNLGWATSMAFGRRIAHLRTKEFGVRCVKR